MTSPPQIVLVPGFWLGEWAWDDVRASLDDRGFTVTTLALPGRGTVADGPQDQADAILAALDRSTGRRVLVVHSGAAIAGTIVIDQHPGLVDHVVWVDTAPVPDGYAMNPGLTAEWYRLEDAWAQEQEGGAMRDLTERQLQTFRERAVPEAAAVLTTAVRLSDDRRHDVASTVVCTEYSAQDYRSYAGQGVPFLAALPHYRNLRYVDLPTGHWPMWSRPRELAGLIAEAAS
jgi:pimeloyl-ACP methyl ester carboxylesterase